MPDTGSFQAPTVWPLDKLVPYARNPRNNGEI